MNQSGNHHDSAFELPRRADGHGGRRTAFVATFAATSLPLLALRLATLDRAASYNPSIPIDEIYRAMPGLMREDILAGILCALACGFAGFWLARLKPLLTRKVAVDQDLETATSNLTWRSLFIWPLDKPGLIAANCITLLATVQYRVYGDLGFFPGVVTMAHFADPNGPFANSARSFITLDTLGLLLFVLFVPLLTYVAALRMSRRPHAWTLPLLLAAAAWGWPISPELAAMAKTPVRRLVQTTYHAAKQADPEVLPEPPDFASISGTAQRVACDSKIERIERPSFVIVIMESTGEQYLYENGRWRFPGLARIAEHAIRFPHFYAPAGRSNPAMNSILTSRYLLPSEGWWNQEVRETRSSLPQSLAENGYDTAFHMAGCFRFFFDEPLFRGLGWTECLDGDELAQRYEIPNELRDADGGCIDDARLITHAIEWMRARPDGRPFLDLIYPGIPHSPYEFMSDGPWSMHRGDEVTQRERYDNQLAYVDQQISRIHDELLASGFYDRGYLIITGDHGEAFGQHPGNFVHGTELYEENSRVPMLIVNPNLVNATDCTTPGSHIDFAPTILDLANIEVPPEMMGASLLHPTGPEMILLAANVDGVHFAVVDGTMKLIHRTDGRADELYDLSADPGEQNNIAPHKPKLTAQYRSWIKSVVYHRLTPDTLKSSDPQKQRILEARRLAHNGQPQQALRFYKEALAASPDDATLSVETAWCRFDLAIQLRDLRRNAEANEFFNKAAKVLHDKPTAIAAYADLLSQLHQVDAACNLLRKSLPATSNDPLILARLAWYDADDATRTIALNDLTNLIHGNPTTPDPIATFLLFELKARNFASRGQFDQALAMCDQAEESLQRADHLTRQSLQPGLEHRREAYANRQCPADEPFPIRINGRPAADASSPSFRPPSASPATTP